MATMSKDLNQLRKRAISQGWKVEQSSGGHIKWFPPHGEPFYVSAATPSDYRAIKKIKADLRRRGLKLDGQHCPKKKATI